MKEVICHQVSHSYDGITMFTAPSFTGHETRTFLIVARDAEPYSARGTARAHTACWPTALVANTKRHISTEGS